MDPVWKLEEHTHAKHLLLESYLKAWFPILASHEKRIIFLDGFAGPGVYSDGEDGSPIIALRTLVEHDRFDKWSDTEFIFVFVEADSERHENLVNQINEFWDSIGGKPSNIGVVIRCAKFADVARDILDEVRGQLAPTLAFIDPFGWSGVPLQLISELLSSDKCEVIFNFMFDSVNRWVALDESAVAVHFAELFGSTDAEHLHASTLSGTERKEFLRDLYAEKLRDVAGFTFVRPFEMVDVQRHRTAYYLMYGTRHEQGLRAMKEAMWRVAPIDGIRFSGFADKRRVLFDLEPDFRPLREALVAKFASQTVPVETVERFVLVETPYMASHYKRHVLKQLEEESLIECKGRQRKKTYPAGTEITFSPSQ